jgi:hypothetical protein
MRTVGIVTPGPIGYVRVVLTPEAFDAVCDEAERVTGLPLDDLVEFDEFWSFVEAYEAFYAETEPQLVEITEGPRALLENSDTATLDKFLEALAKRCGYVIPVASSRGDVGDELEAARQRLVAAVKGGEYVS